MISHARYAYFAIVSNVLVASQLAGKRQGKRECPFDAFALPGGSKMALRSQNAPAAFYELARANRSAATRRPPSAFPIARRTLAGDCS